MVHFLHVWKWENYHALYVCQCFIQYHNYCDLKYNGEGKDTSCNNNGLGCVKYRLTKFHVTKMKLLNSVAEQLIINAINRTPLSIISTTIAVSQFRCYILFGYNNRLKHQNRYMHSF